LDGGLPAGYESLKERASLPFFGYFFRVFRFYGAPLKPALRVLSTGEAAGSAF